MYIEIHEKVIVSLNHMINFSFICFEDIKFVFYRVLNHMGVAEGICKFESAREPRALNHSCNADGWSQEGKCKFLNLKFCFYEFLFQFHCFGVGIGQCVQSGGPGSPW